MKKRQWKKLKKKVRVGLEKGQNYLNWREKNFLGLILYTDLRHEITKEIDNHIIAQMRELAEVRPMPDMDLTKIFPDKNGVYVLTGKPTYVYSDETHRGRWYPTKIFDKEVADYEKTNNSDKEDI